jgi:AcrR family transcriptional regulator
MQKGPISAKKRNFKGNKVLKKNTILYIIRYDTYRFLNKDRSSRMKEKKSAKQPRNKEKILESTLQVLENTSYPSLTIEAIAAHAGAGKTTIYRWWDTKAHLVLDAFLMYTASSFQFDIEDSVRSNFQRQLTNLASVFSSKIGRSMLAIIVENEEISKSFYTSFLTLRRRDATLFLEAAIKRKEIKPDLNTDIILDMLLGPIYFRILIYNQEPDERFITNLVDHIITGILCSSDERR